MASSECLARCMWQSMDSHLLLSLFNPEAGMACISVLGGQTAPITLSRRRRRDVSGARPVWRLLLVRDRSSRRSCQQLLLVREKNTAERETRSTDGDSGRRNDTSVSDPTTRGATNVLGVRRLVGARAAVPVAGRTEPPTAHARSHDRERARQGVGAPGSRLQPARPVAPRCSSPRPAGRRSRRRRRSAHMGLRPLLARVVPVSRVQQCGTTTRGAGGAAVPPLARHGST